MSDRSVGVYDAKSSLTKLLSDVQKGDTVTITKHGKPIARLVPVVEEQQQKASEAIEALRTFHRGRKLDGLSIRDMIDEGRS